MISTSYADDAPPTTSMSHRSEEHTSELQSPCNLVCRLLLEKKKQNYELQRPCNLLCRLLLEKNLASKHDRIYLTAHDIGPSVPVLGLHASITARSLANPPSA